MHPHPQIKQTHQAHNMGRRLLLKHQQSVAAICHFKMQDGCKKTLCQLLRAYGEMLATQLVWLEECQSHGTCEVGCIY